jgi:hypothetical protein
MKLNNFYGIYLVSHDRWGTKYGGKKCGIREIVYGSY